MSSRQLIDLSPDLKRLRDERYEIQIVAEHLVVKNVPYVKADKSVAYGALAAPITREGVKAGKPPRHTMYFDGERPHDNVGSPLDNKILSHPENRDLFPGFHADFMFSTKSEDGSSWADYYALVRTYVDILAGYAVRIDKNASPLTGRAFDPDEPPSVFAYPDSATARASITEAVRKLEGHVIAIVGLGGTGSYVLDFVAKTPVKEIHLFDGDRFINHNAFRAPGAASLADVSAIPPLFKVDYLKCKYEVLHLGITAHPQRVTADNVNKLVQADFVFLCMDEPPAKKIVVEALVAAGKPFVDVGMGVTMEEAHLGGNLRTTFSANEKRKHERNGVPLGDDAEDEYDTNIQIVELNALNAALAVIRWKKHLGFYYARNPEYSSLYTLQFNGLSNEDRLEAAT